MAKPSKKGKAQKRARRERRFEPRASGSVPLVVVVGGLGSILLGAGAYGQFAMHDAEGNPFKYATYFLAAGAVLLGIAIWFGTSGEPALRVGDPGVATERGGLKRMAWHAIEKIEWTGSAVRVTGEDEAGTKLTVAVNVKTQPQAAAWIVKEARERVPGVVEVPDDAGIPEARAEAGQTMTAEPAQVVGKHCAASGKVIAYEPDARICPRCERVYHKSSVPESCECGASLASLRSEPAKAG
jgi:hypothetical protein